MEANQVEMTEREKLSWNFFRVSTRLNIDHHFSEFRQNLFYFVTPQVFFLNQVSNIKNEQSRLGCGGHSVAVEPEVMGSALVDANFPAFQFVHEPTGEYFQPEQCRQLQKQL